jgi:hypothetical protein
VFFVLLVPVDGDSGIYSMSPEEGRGVLGFRVRGGDVFGCSIAREDVLLSITRVSLSLVLVWSVKVAVVSLEVVFLGLVLTIEMVFLVFCKWFLSFVSVEMVLL